MPKSDQLLGKNIPWVEAHHIGAKQRPTAIVLRTSFTTGDPGAAFGIANTWHKDNGRIDSCHYVIDEHQTLRCVPDRFACLSMYTSAFNRKAIVINVCHVPPLEPTENIVCRTSRQVARLCHLYRIKPRLLDRDEQDKWRSRPMKVRGGIILATVGDFPANKFLTSVKQQYRKFD